MALNATLANQTSAIVNQTFHGFSIVSANGLIILVVGALLFIVAGYIVYKILKNLIANAIIGGIGLIVLHFLAPMIGIEIPINLVNIIISILAGLPGLVIVILLAILHL